MYSDDYNSNILTAGMNIVVTRRAGGNNDDDEIIIIIIITIAAAYGIRPTIAASSEIILYAERSRLRRHLVNHRLEASDREIYGNNNKINSTEDRRSRRRRRER